MKARICCETLCKVKSNEREKRWQVKKKENERKGKTEDKRGKKRLQTRRWRQ